MTTIENTGFRPATTDDASRLAKLIDIAGEGIPNWLWSQWAQPDETALDVGTARAQRTSGGFSYKNALVIGPPGEAVAMMLGYVLSAPTEKDTAEVPRLPAPIRPFVELEHLAAGTYYVNALAVLPGRRGHGYGTSLMRAAEAQAIACGTPSMSIQIFSQNVDALRLYERMGFAIAHRRPVLNHPCQPYYDEDVLLLAKSL